MTLSRIAKFAIGSFTFALGLAIVAVVMPDYRAGLVLIGFGLMYGGLDLLRLNLREQAVLRRALGYPAIAGPDAPASDVTNVSTRDIPKR